MAKKSDPKKKKSPADMSDSSPDREKMQQEETTIELPGVKDIPGQEHVRPLPPGEMADTTISSADEEGEGVFNGSEERMQQFDNNVTRDERELLEASESSMGSDDDLSLGRSRVDNTDGEGEPLNETADNSGSDLDVPGSEADDENEEIGEPDEENNPFSLNDDKEDDVNTRQ